ncbi:MAG: FliH/SctL family protein [Gemmatimonadota bacterium]|nr:FliH/SctL family protein [Gemmatimonadota bacterium]
MSSSSARIFRGGLATAAASPTGGSWRPGEIANVPMALVDDELPPLDPVAEAKARHDKEIHDAYTLGFEEGRHEGEHAEQMRLRTALSAAEESIEILRAGEERWQGMIEENICALAVAIARHIIDREVADNPEIIEKLVKRALNEFPIDHPVRVRVNPTDLQTILSHGGQAAADAITGTPPREAHWIPDSRIAPGGTVVEGRDRIIDGRVDTALERVYRRLTYKNA